MRWYSHYRFGVRFSRGCNNRLETPVGTFIWGDNEDVMNFWGFGFSVLLGGGYYFQSPQGSRQTKNLEWYLIDYLFGKPAAHTAVCRKASYASVVYKGQSVPIMYGTATRWFARRGIPWFKLEKKKVTSYTVGYGDDKIQGLFDEIVSEPEVLRRAKFRLKTRDIEAA